MYVWPVEIPTHYEFDMRKGQQLFGYSPQFDIFPPSNRADALAFRTGQATGVIPTHFLRRCSQHRDEPG